MTGRPMRVLIADDNVLYRQGLASLMASHPTLAVVGEAANGFQAIELARTTRPDIVLMDVHMPTCDGLDATRAIRRESPEVKVLMLSVSDEDEYLFEAIRSGAQGYLLKIMDTAALFETLLRVVRGETAITRYVASRMLREFRVRESSTSPSGPGPQCLTSREREVLELAARGMPPRKIATCLSLDEKLVNSVLQQMLKKLHDGSPASATVKV